MTDPGGLSASLATAIVVRDEKEAPVITSPAAASVAEGGTAVLTVTASDQDAGNTVTLSISGGADAALFDLDAATGALTFKAAPDFEAPADAGSDNVYEVQVRATDNTLLSHDQTILVTVTGVNEAPAFTGAGSASVVEGSSAVMILTASDADAGAVLSYSISGGADAALFAIDAATGALSFIAAPDFETPADQNADNVYELDVTVGDGAGGTDARALLVTVTNTAGVTVLGTAGADLVNATTAPAGQPFPGAEEDTIIGYGGRDRLVGQMGDDLIRGGFGSDILNGGKGDDTLRGGRGLDFLIGGQGKDHFVYAGVIGSSAASGIDRIRDFTQGEDVIDLSGIDADGAGGAFHFLGRARFDGLAGALREHAVGSDLYLEGDIDGDRRSDFTLILKNAAGLHLGGGDLVL